MTLIRKSRLVAALVVALMWMPGLLAPVAAAGSGGPDRPPAMQLAILARSIRVSDYYAAVRRIRRRRRRWLRKRIPFPRRRGPARRERLRSRAWYARGPPGRGHTGRTMATNGAASAAPFA